MKKILITLGILVAAGGTAALVLPPSTWGLVAAKKEHKLPKDFGAYVLNTSDGRTMAISVNNDLYALRVKDIKLPTTEEALHESDLSMRTLVFGRNILVENSFKAADGVYEGDVRVGPDHVAEVQVATGLASVTGNNPTLLSLQETAKASKVGMWAPPPVVADESAPALLAVEETPQPKNP